MHKRAPDMNYIPTTGLSRTQSHSTRSKPLEVLFKEDLD